jgi:hypothetical protein
MTSPAARLACVIFVLLVVFAGVQAVSAERSERGKPAAVLNEEVRGGSGSAAAVDNAILLPPRKASSSQLASALSSAALSSEAVFNRLTEDLPVLSAASQQLDHLILVPCHGTFRGYDFTKYLDESQWGFEQFQLGHDMPAILTEHIRKAVELGAQDPASLVLFSGGQSRVDSASRSEGQSYFDLALANNFAGIDELMRGPSADVPTSSPHAGGAVGFPVNDREQAPFRRVFAEEFARDSYENLLFGVARFYEVTGRYPARITVVGFRYKERRFVDLHRYAIRYPLSRFRYVGIDEVAVQRIAAAAGNAGVVAAVRSAALPLSDARTFARVKEDLYMCKLGRATRRMRNPNRRGVPYYSSVTPPMRALLLHCGPSVFEGTLPWDG